MTAAYNEWADRAGALPWPVKEGLLAKRTKGKRDHISQHRSPPTKLTGMHRIRRISPLIHDLAAIALDGLTCDVACVLRR